MIKDIIIESTEGYEVMYVCAILELYSNNKDELVKKLNLFFYDITSHFDKNRIDVRMEVGQISSILNFSNKDCVKLIIDELKKYLKDAKITIIEQRIPFDSVEYELK